MPAPERPPRSRLSRGVTLALAALLAPAVGLWVWFAGPDRHDALLAMLLYWSMPPALLFAAVAGAIRLREASVAPGASGRTMRR